MTKIEEEIHQSLLKRLSSKNEETNEDSSNNNNNEVIEQINQEQTNGLKQVSLERYIELTEINPKLAQVLQQKI